MIAILFVAWNHLESTTAPCLRSVRSFTDAPYRVLCVDNASADGTGDYLEALARRDPRFTVLPQERNLGWAGGVLAALEHLTPEDTHLCLLNSDVQVTPRWLSRLRAHLEAAPGLTAVIPSEAPDLDGPLRHGLRVARDVLGRVLPRRAPPAADPAAMVPGSLPAPPPPLLAQVLETAARVERRYRGRSRPAAPSGFCLLTARAHEGVLRAYLGEFDRYRSGELDWRELWEGRGASCREALDVHVFHARGGSGSYYRYSRSRPRTSSR